MRGETQQQGFGQAPRKTFYFSSLLFDVREHHCICLDMYLLLGVFGAPEWLETPQKRLPGIVDLV